MTEGAGHSQERDRAAGAEAPDDSTAPAGQPTEPPLDDVATPPAAERGAESEAPDGGLARPLALLQGLSPELVEGEEMPRVHATRRRALAFGVFVAFVVAFLYFVLPHVTGLERTWNRIDTGDPIWLVVAVVLELLAYSSYVALFRSVFARDSSRLGWRESYEITLAGLMATRLFAAAGAGGVALMAWALRREGMERRVVARRMVAFLAMLYTVYMAAFVIDGIALRTGLFAGGGDFAITIVPAIFGVVFIAVVVLISLIPEDIERRLERRARGSGRLARWLARGVSVPAFVAGGIRTAFGIARSKDPAALGAIAWWGFDMAVLWAAFHAFGNPPPYAVIVMAYFVGMLANLLPLPGGVGGVDGGMIGALIAFGVDSGLAVVSVLAYRAIAFWLPILPGAVAYFALRRTVHRWQGESPQERATGASHPAPV
jgi:uncharacterized protein (TIRG00374 family)